MDISITRVKQIVKTLSCSEYKAVRIAYYEQQELANKKKQEEASQLNKAKTDPAEFKKLLMKAMRQK